MVKFPMGAIVLKELTLAIRFTIPFLVALTKDVAGMDAEGNYKLYGIGSDLTISVPLWRQIYWR